VVKFLCLVKLKNGLQGFAQHPVNGIRDADTAKCFEPSNLKESPNYQDEDKREADIAHNTNEFDPILCLL